MFRDLLVMHLQGVTQYRNSGLFIGHILETAEVNRPSLLEAVLEFLFFKSF